MKLRNVGRLVGALLVAAGFVLVFMTIAQRSSQKFMALGEPSYFVKRNLTLALMTSIVAIAVALVSCFTSWFTTMDEDGRTEPNAPGLTEEQLETEIGSSSLGESRTATTQSTQAEETSEDYDTAHLTPADEGDTAQL